MTQTSIQGHEAICRALGIDPTDRPIGKNFGWSSRHERPGSWSGYINAEFKKTNPSYDLSFPVIAKHAADGGWSIELRPETVLNLPLSLDREARTAMKADARRKLKEALNAGGIPCDDDLVVAHGPTRTAAADAAALAVAIAATAKKGVTLKKWLEDARVAHAELEGKHLAEDRARAAAQQQREDDEARLERGNDIVAEALRLDAEGILDHSSSLAVLKDLVERFKAIALGKSS